MKLWKTKKPTSCVPGRFKKGDSEDKSNCTSGSSASTSTTNTANGIPLNAIVSGERAMSPAQSEDSGLAPERGTTYATIHLSRDNAPAMGIVLADRTDVSYPPIIYSLNPLGPAADFLAPGDRIHQVDGISTIGLTNQQVMSMLCHGDATAIIEIEYSLPEYISQNSLCVTSKLAQITIERENGCLGLTLRGGGDFPLIVTHVRPHGPVFKTGRIKPGDRLLHVDNVPLVNKSLAEVQQILKCGHSSGYTNLVIEYDVSLNQSVEFSMGPLLIEIERPMNDKLGLVLSHYNPSNAASQMGPLDPSKLDEVTSADMGVYISSILPASIADRCGALSVGDQILSIDDTVIEHSSYSPEEVMALLDTNTGRGYTQLQIMPSHTLARRGYYMGNPKYSCGTLESRKCRPKKFTRKSSLPLEFTQSSLIGVCRSETVLVALDCSQGSGIILGSQSANGKGVTIAQIVPDSVAERTGCIQKGDRIISVNKMYNLDITTIRQLLTDVGAKPSPVYQNTNWVEMEIEFDLSDAVVPSSGVFNVKLAKTGKADLGITVINSNNGAFIISEVKPGSPAHRTGSLRAGDILLAVDSHPLQHFNLDALLKDNKNDFTTLTIKRDSIPEFFFDGQQKAVGSLCYNDLYGNSYGHMKAATPQPEYFQNMQVPMRQKTPKQMTPSSVGRPFAENITESVGEDVYGDLSSYDTDYLSDRFTTLSCRIPPPMENKNYGAGHTTIVNIQLEPNGGPLGITLAGSEDTTKPISISGVTPGGIADKTGEIFIGDSLVAINGEPVKGMPLSRATKMLQSLTNNVVHLKLIRNFDYSNEGSANIAQGQTLYAKVQRPRPRSPSFTDIQSNGSANDPNKFRILNVSLFKDKNYDDYGFSLSDGLFDKGVYINRMRQGGPAAMSGLLKPFDRILQVNGTKTFDFDCCLTVPLIAAAGDQIELVIQRLITDQ